MSNFFMLVSSREINKTGLKRINLPKAVEEVVNFNPKYAYAVFSYADVEKTLEAKESAPEFYQKTCEFFNWLYEIVKEVKSRKGEVALLESYMGEDFTDKILKITPFPIEKFKGEPLGFEFETVYNITE